MKKLLPLLIILSACGTTKNIPIQEPYHSRKDTYIKHYAYSLVFNENTKQSDWVAYKLSDYQLEKNFKRKDNFRPDTLIKTGTATVSDYKRSGYDRGHLVPAADMTWSEQAMDESFLFSNISPQLAKFNRGIWKHLESQVRKWAEAYDSIYICTGPVFENKDISIGNNVIVPTHFYKTVLIYNDTIKQSIGFIFPHKSIKGDYYNYSTTIDSIEQVTGLDFYYSLPDKIEKIIESEVNMEYWKVK